MLPALQILTERLAQLAPEAFLVKAGPRPEQAVAIVDVSAVELSRSNQPALPLLVRNFSEPITSKTPPAVAGALLHGALRALPDGMGETLVVALPFPPSLGFVRGAHWIEAIMDGVITFWRDCPQTTLERVIVAIAPEIDLVVPPTSQGAVPKTIAELIVAMEKTRTFEDLLMLIDGFQEAGEQSLRCRITYDSGTIDLTKADLITILSDFATPLNFDPAHFNDRYLLCQWSSTAERFSERFKAHLLALFDHEINFLRRFYRGEKNTSDTSLSARDRLLNTSRRWWQYRSVSEVPSHMGLASFQKFVADIGSIRDATDLEPQAKSAAIKTVCCQHEWPWHDHVILMSGARYIDVLLPTTATSPHDRLKEIYQGYAKMTHRLRARYPFLNFLWLYRELFPGDEFQPLIADLEKIARDPETP